MSHAANGLTHEFGLRKFMNANAAGMVVTALSVLLGFGWISSGHGAESDGGGANNVGNAPIGLSQVTETPTPALADLQVGWYFEHWWDGCIQRGQPRILMVSVTNLGGAAAGPFVVRDGQVIWQAPGLAAGARWSVTEWGPYVEWPLEVDPYDQVPESNEDNNVVVPSANPTWSPTIPAPGSDRGTPRARNHNQIVSPAPVMTLPVFCTPAAPVPTLTPWGEPPLPNLYVVSAQWDRLAIQMPGAAGPCLPADEPWTFELTIGNSGSAPAGWFSVSGSGAVWRVPGLGAGETMALTGS